MPATDEPRPNTERLGWLERSLHRTRQLVLGILNFIGQHEFKVLAAMFVLVLTILAFAAIADEVSDGATQRFDEGVLRALRRPDDPSKPIAPAWFSEVSRDITALGSLAVLTLLTVAISGFLWLRGMYGAMILVIVATFGGLIAATLLKGVFDRPRPPTVSHLAVVQTSSFPSGHSTLSATVFLTLGTLLGQFVKERRLKAYFLLVAIFLTFLVGASRIYLGVHYPTDVLAGWAAGLAWATLCWLVARFLQHHGRVEEGRLA
jgi:undecaprenyl-diphosphatase